VPDGSVLLQETRRKMAGRRTVEKMCMKRTGLNLEILSLDKPSFVNREPDNDFKIAFTDEMV
jgi:hypothetical protein